MLPPDLLRVREYLGKSHFNDLFLALSIALSLFLYFRFVLQVDFWNTPFFNLLPAPDAIEYLATAVNISSNNSFSIQFGEQLLPPRYPMGFPILIALALKLGDFLGISDPIFAPFLTNQLFGLLLLALLVIFYFHLGLRNYLILPLLLTVTFPSFVLLARSSLSEVTGAFFLLAGILTISLHFLNTKPYLLYSGTFLIGIACNFRLQAVFYLPILLGIFMPIEVKAHSRIRQIALSLIFFVCAFLPTLIYNWSELGSPFNTGYGFWVPAIGFHLDVLPQNLQAWLKELLLCSDSANVSGIFGNGNYFSPALIILIVISTFILLTYKWLRPLLLVNLFYIGILLLYPFGNDLRFFFVPSLSIIFLTGLAFRAVFFGAKRHYLFKVSFLLLSICAIIGIPYYRGHDSNGSGLGIFDLSNIRTEQPLEFLSIRQVQKKLKRVKTLVLSPSSPIYLNALLDNQYTAIPYIELLDYSHSQLFHYNNSNIMQELTVAMKNKQRILYVSNIYLDYLHAPNEAIEAFLKSKDCRWRDLGTRLQLDSKFVLKKLICKLWNHKQNSRKINHSLDYIKTSRISPKLNSYNMQ